MQSQSRLLEDLARVASSAMGVASGMRGEIEQRLKEQFETVLSRMDLVTREEFDAVRAMAQKAREAQEVLNERLAAMEEALAAQSKAPRKPKPASGGEGASEDGPDTQNAIKPAATDATTAAAASGDANTGSSKA